MKKNFTPSRLEIIEYKFLFYYCINNSRSESSVFSLLKNLSLSEFFDPIDGGFFNFPNSSSINSTESDFNHTKTLLFNNQCIDLFIAASGFYLDALFSVPVISSIQWINDHLTTNDHLFYNEMKAENNQSDYYRLDAQRLNTILDQDSYTIFMSAYNLSNSENITYLKRQADNHQISTLTGFHIKQIPLALENSHQLLKSFRRQTDTPQIVKSINIENNLKFIISLYQAARLFNRDDLSQLAQQSLEQIIQHKSNLDRETTDLSNFCLINALLSRLQYQWCDVSFNWLLEFALKLVNTPSTYSNLFSNNKLESGLCESIINDLHNLYFLSSEVIFLKTARQLVNELIKQIQIQNNSHGLLLTLSATSFEPSFIIIRGGNFQVTDWLQKISTGFKPNQFVYGIAENCNGPDQNKFPLSGQLKAVAYKLSGSSEEFTCLDRLLDFFP